MISAEPTQLSLHSPITPRAISNNAVPLTDMQLRVWRRLLHGGSSRTQRMLAGTTRILGRLDLGLLRASAESIVARHEALRTRFGTPHQTPVQYFDAALSWESIDLTLTPAANIEKHATRVAAECIEEAIDISVGPLLSIKTLRLGTTDHVLIVSIEHMIADDDSFRILQSEIWSRYNQALLGRTPSLADVPLQFGDYALWQARTRAAWRQKHASYWTHRLAGALPVRIPVEQTAEGAACAEDPTLTFSLGAGLSTRLRELARQQRSPLSLVVLAIYLIVMSRWCRQTDLLVIVVSNGRFHAGLRNTVGWLATHLYLRIELHVDDSFSDVLSRIRQEFGLALTHRDFDRVPELVPECDTDLYFNWRTGGSAPVAPIPPQQAAPIKRLPFDVPRRWPRKFIPFFFDTPMGIGIRLDYAPDLYSRHVAQRFARDMRRAADEFSNTPLGRICSTGESSQD